MTLVDLFAHRHNVHSQNGEDGIIAKLMELGAIETGFFVEFGAWDGKHLSNTYALYERGWAGCMIEGDAQRYEKLCANIPDQRVTKINTFVAPGGEQSLDGIVERFAIPPITLLSVDIDSDDLAVWQGLTVLRPPIVVIEYNPTMPFDMRYINPLGFNHGNAARSIVEVAEARGYVLIEGTATNLFFVQHEFPGLARIKRKSLVDIHDQLGLTRLAFGQDGTLLMTRGDHGHTREVYSLPWQHLCVFRQPLPRFLRGYEGSKAVKLARALHTNGFCLLANPLAYIKEVGGYVWLKGLPGRTASGKGGCADHLPG